MKQPWTPRLQRKLINRLSHIARQHSSTSAPVVYHVYVLMVAPHDDSVRPLDFYIGQTGKDLEDRLAEHQAGMAKSARIFRSGRYAALGYHPDWMQGLPEFASRRAAMAAERKTAEFLQSLGYQLHYG